MSIAELDRIEEIDRSEHISQQYVVRDGVLAVIDVDIRAPRWGEPGEAAVQDYVGSWGALLQRDGVLLGAFDGDSLVGVAIYDRSFAREPARLAELYVSRSHRRWGVGRALTREIVRLARDDGASRLYVSATPTRGTVDFYMSEGFEVLAEPNESLLEREPEDIHMALALSAADAACRR